MAEEEPLLPQEELICIGEEHVIHGIESILVEEDQDEDNEILLLEAMLARSKEAKAKRDADEERIANMASVMEKQKRSAMLESQVFHGNAHDFAHVLQGPMHVRRVVDENNHTSCFMVSSNGFSSPGEIIASWDKTRLVVHPWNAAVPNQSFSIDQIVKKSQHTSLLGNGSHGRGQRGNHNITGFNGRGKRGVQRGLLNTNRLVPKSTIATVKSRRALQPINVPNGGFGGFPKHNNTSDGHVYRSLGSNE